MRSDRIQAWFKSKYFGFKCTYITNKLSNHVKLFSNKEGKTRKGWNILLCSLLTSFIDKSHTNSYNKSNGEMWKRSNLRTSISN